MGRAGRAHPWRKRSCPTRKLAFGTADEAGLYASNTGIGLASYQCPHCQRYHLTGTDKEKKR